MTDSTNAMLEPPKGKRSWLRWVGLCLAGLAALGTLCALCLWFTYKDAFGVPAWERNLALLQTSPQWKAQEEVFENPQPLWNNTSIMATISAYQSASPDLAPKDPAKEIPQVKPSLEELAPQNDAGVFVTWFGHSSMYLQVDGLKFLIDPVWESTSPIPWLGPARWFQPSLGLNELPVPDAVVISHDHYDHLDYESIVQIKDWNTKFVVPLGVGAHLVMWGVDASKVVELDWNENEQFGSLSLVCVPARHASGRGALDQNATLWSGWAFIGKNSRAYYSGDTGLFDGMKEIGQTLGPFDLAMIEVGQYHPNWPDWHLGPEQAVLAAQWVRAKKLLPVHWGAFTLAMHSWTAPVERTAIAAKEAGMPIITPRPGEPVNPATSQTKAWWTPGVPFLSANEQPVVANLANGRPAHRED